MSFRKEHCIAICTVNGSIEPSIKTIVEQARLTGIIVVVFQQVHPPSPTIPPLLLPCNLL